MLSAECAMSFISTVIWSEGSFQQNKGISAFLLEKSENIKRAVKAFCRNVHLAARTWLAYTI